MEKKTRVDKVVSLADAVNILDFCIQKTWPETKVVTL